MKARSMKNPRDQPSRGAWRRKAPKPAKIRFHLWLTESQLTAAEEAAAEQHRSVADMLRLLIDDGLTMYQVKHRR